MKVTIGNVLLNLDYYDGEDAYSDGSIEDRLLEIVKTTPKEDYQKVILTEKSWPIFYHLSPERENILDWYESVSYTHLTLPACSAEMQSG